MVLNASNLLLITSLSESGPLIIKEAMACNLPIVSTDIGDIKSIFTKKLKGCYVTNFNKRELIDSINKVLSYNKRTNGRDIIKELELDAISIAKKINIMYQTI